MPASDPVEAAIDAAAGEEVAVDPLAGIERQAIERINDLFSRLDWESTQKLVAGILRTMVTSQVPRRAQIAARTSSRRQMALPSKIRELW
ncbi:hypothetical protein [Cupriavidus alkaliphilus]|uniref:hypothetical protein n=1 Tax=Cupriavidus alkaliphilus TaxID=942866 RepID=UPI0021AC9AB4|nr:hypothetical protein [Cupriavidus alkaliphilus]